MNIRVTEDQVSIILNQFRVKYEKLTMLSNQVVLFAIKDFGLVICCIERIDYAQVSNKINEQFFDWRCMYITTNEIVLNKRYDILWELMRGGYMKWLRYNFPRQIKNILLGPDNLARIIIEERLKIWNNETKYKFYIDDNISALKGNLGRELVNDPSFFDYMPENKKEDINNV